MTDNDIVKALEIGKTTCFCEDCPLYDGKVHNCTQLMSTVALDLINRKQTEIKRLKNKVEELSEILSDTIRIRYAETRAEAVKEFAEKLKELDGCDNHTFDDCVSLLVSEEYKKGRYEKTNEIWNTIDNLLKEMVGDE